LSQFNINERDLGADGNHAQGERSCSSSAVDLLLIQDVVQSGRNASVFPS
jgi:hypothetical protein